MDRGVLNDLLRGDIETLKQGLEAMTDGYINRLMKKENIAYRDLAWAMAKARIKELENRISSISHKTANLELAKATRDTITS